MSEAATTVQGTTAGGASASSQPNTSGAGTSPWYSGFADDVKGYVEHKGWKGPDAVIDSYRNLEKLVHGAPPERIIRLPEKLDDEKELAGIYAKLGRPEKPEGYEVPIPEGGSKEFAEWAKTQFHGLGLSKRQGEKLATAWNEYAAGLTTKMEEERNNSMGQQADVLRKEWGQAFDQNVVQVNAFAEQIGLSPEQAYKMAGVLGVDGLNKMLFGIMEKYGIKIGENDFKGGGSQGAAFTGNILSPAAARARLDALKSDPTWVNKYLNKDKDAIAESDRLHQWAYSDAN